MRTAFPVAVMMPRYEVFDAEEVQFDTRRRVARLTGLVATAVVVSVLAAGAGHAGAIPTLAAGGLVCAVWLGTAWWVARQLRRLRRVVWCVKLSDASVEGYDYARRKTRLRWTQVRRVELTEKGLRLFVSPLCYLDVPICFPGFTSLSHGVIDRAEHYDIPVHVDGRPFEEIDVYAFFPDLLARPARPPRSPSQGARGAARGPTAA